MGIGRVCLSSVVALAQNGAVDSMSFKIENGVVIENSENKLDDLNFHTAINRHPWMMVMFYAPWCHYSKALKPEFEKAAQKLNEIGEDGVGLAKVDADSQKALATEYAIRKFPTVIVFKGGKVFSTYFGNRDEDDIVGYMSSISQPEPFSTLIRVYYDTPKNMGLALTCLVLLLVALCFCCCWCCCFRKLARQDKKVAASHDKDEDSDSSTSCSSSLG